MFHNFISLGAWCPTAASMSKYGLRNGSFLFDWLGTPRFESVIHFIENEFSDFLLKENLEHLPGNVEVFKDKKFDVVFPHDREYSVGLEKSYDVLYQKYQRKINYFNKEMKNRNCFLRSVMSDVELKYIINHEKDINRAIKRENKESEIIFLLKKELSVPDNLNFRYYIMPGIHDTSEALLRNWFDNAEDFLLYCQSNLSKYIIMKNVAFDREQRRKRAEQQAVIANSRYELLLKLIRYNFLDFSIGLELIIYGAGDIGKVFYSQIKSRCCVKCFIDSAKGGGPCIDGIPVLWLDELEDADLQSTCFLVTVAYDYENICRVIHRYFPNAAIISLEKLIL